MLGLVRDWLQREEAGPWLMVLDNVDDINLFYPSSSAGRDKAVCHPADENSAALSVQQPLAVFLPKRRNGIILVTPCSMDAAEKLTGSHKAVYGISIVEEEPPEKDLEQWAYLLTNCAWYLVTTGSYKAAEKLGERAVKTIANVLGEEHPDTLGNMNNLASTFRNQGRWKEAEELQV